MSKNETIRNLLTPIPEPRSPGLVPEKANSEKSSSSMPLDGRIERRVPMALPVDLLIAEEALFAERVVTVDVSPHGARVVTKRRWRPEEQPWLASLTSYFRRQGSVVYCQPLSNGDFCVGLRFPASFIDWEDRLWR
jgi:PilZ domain